MNTPTMEITKVTEKDLEVITTYLSKPENGEDDRFAFALKLMKEEGKIIKLIAE